MSTRHRMVILKNEFRKTKGAMPAVIRDNRFVIEVLRQQEGSLEALLGAPADLLVVDLCAQPEDGLNIIKELRLHGAKTEVVAYISPDDAQTLKAALRLGVVDCITHPFETERFLQAVERFLRRVQFAGSELTQDAVDSMLSSVGIGEVQLPKGLQKKTLNKIRAVFSQCPDTLLSCDDVVEAVKLSRITVQRYLCYLSDNEELLQDMNYETGGRPRNLYQYNCGVFA